MGLGGPLIDFTLLAAAASHFASFPAVPSDHTAQQFLDQFPLPILFSALDRGSNVPGLESAVTTSLEKIFSSSYGRSLLPQALPYAVVGFSASSALVRRLTCFAVMMLLTDSDADDGAAVRILAQSDAVFPLFSAVADVDANVATMAGYAVEELAKTSSGLHLIFATPGVGATQLKQMISHESGMVRIRGLAVASKIFGKSDAGASAIQQAGMLKSLEDELSNTSDILAQINALELLAEMAEVPTRASFLLTGHVIGHLGYMIENTTIDSLARSRAMIVGARLLSSFHSVTAPVSDADASSVVSAIDKNIQYLNSSDDNPALIITEQETALDSLGEIGISSRGAELLLCGSEPAARHLIEVAFRQHGGGVQLAALHSLASVAGAERSSRSVSPLLNEEAESSLRTLIYSATGGIASRTPADLLWSLLKQGPDIRIATYRFIGVMVARSWILWEICSHRGLVDAIANPQTESEKVAMEWRHACCASVSSALEAGTKRGDQFPRDVMNQLKAATERGPFWFLEQREEARPEVATQGRS